ncbi:MAG: hypothetical protein H7Y43_11525 [Akkermansiaceae bacterium]|nr:hypothetical protein [Verrucomicrobiales bacterium]
MKTRLAFLLGSLALAGLIAFNFSKPAAPVSLPSNLSGTDRHHADLAKVSRETLPLPRSYRPQRSDREELILQLVHDIEQALNSPNRADRELVFTNLLSALIAQDPARAAQLAEATEPDQGRADLLRRVAQEWAAVNPAAAIEWASRLEFPNERVGSLVDSCLQIAQSDPAEAIALAERFELGCYYSTLENLVQLWAEKDFSAALDWVRTQPEGDQRDLSIARVAFQQAQTKPDAAVRFILEYMTPGDAQVEAAISILHQWVLRDPAGAAVWVELFPEGPLRQRAQKEITGFQAAQLLQ